MTGRDRTLTQSSVRPAGHDFADDKQWALNAKVLGVRLPKSGTPLTTGRMRPWLRKLGISNERYLDYSGGQQLKQFIPANPGWTLRAFAGLMTELALQT